MPQGALYKAISNLIKNGPVQEVVNEQKPKFKDRLATWIAYETKAMQSDRNRYYQYSFTGRGQFDFWLYVVFNQDYGLNGLKMIINKDLSARDISAETVKTLKNIFSQPEIAEFTEAVGAAITEPILTVLERYSGDDTKDPKDMARAFHGILATITGSAGIIDIVGETLSLGQVEGIGRLVQSVYWNMGLGFLGWQTLAPLLTAGLQPGLERYYQRLYRPQRFNASQLQDLYALGMITADSLVTDMRALGWRDDDITKLVKLSYRTLTQGDVWEALKQGKMTQEQAVQRLRALGYDPADIPILMAINADQYAQEEKLTTKTTAIQAFREHLIPESELRTLLAKLEINPNEIELIVAVEKAKDKQDTKSLTISQIKAAWTENVLSDQEAIHYLSVSGFTDPDITTIIATWKREVVPTFRKINKGTIIDAYVTGILNRPTALAKLTSVGFANEDASLELDLAERRNPELFGLPSPKQSKALAPGTLAALVVAGLIDKQDMQNRLVASGYTVEDASLMAEAAELRKQSAPEKLNQYTIERAYIAGVLDRSGADDQLRLMGFDADRSKVILDTVESENPSVFAPETIVTVRMPSITVLVEAVRNGIITEAEFYQRTTELGYEQLDAALYLAVSSTNERKSTKQLSQAQIVNAYGKSLFTRGQALERLVSMGYSDADATILLKMERLLPSETEEWSSMLSKAISVENCITQLLADNFTVKEIREAFASLSDLLLSGFGTSKTDINSVLDQIDQALNSPEVTQ